MTHLDPTAGHQQPSNTSPAQAAYPPPPTQTTQNCTRSEFRASRKAGVPKSSNDNATRKAWWKKFDPKIWRARRACREKQAVGATSRQVIEADFVDTHCRGFERPPTRSNPGPGWRPTRQGGASDRRRTISIIAIEPAGTTEVEDGGGETPQEWAARCLQSLGELPTKP